MNFLRGILTVLFAIVIANPACCCTARHRDQPTQVSHCCGETKKEKSTHEACSCAAKPLKQAEDPPVLPGVPVVAMPPAPFPVVLLSIAPAVPVKELPRIDFRTDTGPPRHRLLRFQTFLI